MRPPLAEPTEEEIDMSIHVKAAPSQFPPPMTSMTPREHGDPCSLVIFGATGDLAKRKLFAAVYHLAKGRLLAHDFRLIGVDRVAMTDDEFRALVKKCVEASEEISGFDQATWEDFEHRLYYLQGDLTQTSAYTTLRERLHALESKLEARSANRLFYLSVPPFIFREIIDHLSSSGLAPRTESPKGKPWARIIIEKPFGHNLASALSLNQLVLSHFNEHQIYRIDHYLGKETVQNILVFRAANAIFEPIWNRNHISHVQITAAETVGVEARGNYYEHAGVVRDMFQNHLMQLLALTAMELPHQMKANLVRDEKVKAMRSIRPFTLGAFQETVRAQYAPGEIKGKPVPGYREEPGVAADSVTPTYAAIKLMIDNGRWRGVPFYLRSGKRMAKRVTEIAIQFHKPAYLIDGLTGLEPGTEVEPNVLVLRVQPDDGVTLRFSAKAPGAALALTPEIEVASVDMDFTYTEAFEQTLSPAYETLILDCMIGDATLFTRSDEVEAGWHITDPLLEYWAANPPAAGLPTYASGSWGPEEADILLERDGFAWRKP
jgi:glucose-6-phosphate 1-dehydrogenase